MTAQLALYVGQIEYLRDTGRLQDTRDLYFFAGFDRTLCAYLNHEHSRTLEIEMDERFSYLELGFRARRGGRVGTAIGLARSALRLAEHSRRFRIDAVVAFEPHLLGLAGWVVARRLRVPLAIRIVQHYGLKYQTTGAMACPPFGSRRREEAVERWLYRRADAVLVACPSHEEYVRGIAGPGARVLPYLTAQPSLYYADFQPDSRLRQELAPGVERLIVAVSRLASEKYPEDLIDCAALLRQDPGLALLICGDGPLRLTLEKQARECGARVIFAGFQPADRLRTLYATADAVIVLQGGGAITQAALTGAPIASYDFEMNPFVVRPEFDEGLLVPFRNTQALADAVRRLVSDPDYARRIGRRAQRAARARFDDSRARCAERAIAGTLLGAPLEPPDADLWQVSWRDRSLAAP